MIYIISFRFTSDSNTHNVDKQFLWGPAFLITPVIDQVYQCFNFVLFNCQCDNKKRLKIVNNTVYYL